MQGGGIQGTGKSVGCFFPQPRIPHPVPSYQRLAAKQSFGKNRFQTIEEQRSPMFVDQIEKMKQQYTDKYVVVDAARPELARFRDIVGRVKTVNMSGRALVEFDDYHLTIGWYDIAPEFLKVVDKPPPKTPKPESKKATPKAAPAARKPTGEAA